MPVSGNDHFLAPFDLFKQGRQMCLGGMHIHSLAHEPKLS
jgi:hypothetical protein